MVSDQLMRGLSLSSAHMSRLLQAVNLRRNLAARNGGMALTTQGPQAPAVTMDNCNESKLAACLLVRAQPCPLSRPLGGQATAANEMLQRHLAARPETGVDDLRV